MTFRRRSAGRVLQDELSTLPGVRLSPLGYKQISSGHEDLDTALDGGLTLGSLTLVIQDTPTAYYRSFPFAYFLAQGIAHGHATAIVTTLTNPHTFFHNLPSPVSSTQHTTNANFTKEDSPQQIPRIAWRYYKSNKPSTIDASHFSKTQSPKTKSYCHLFDLSQPSNITPSSSSPISLLGLHNTLNPNSILVDLTSHAIHAQKNKLPCRIGILDMDLLHLNNYSGGLLGFILRLKALSRKYNAAIMIGLREMSNNIGIITDTCLILESFDGKGTAIAGLQDGLMLIKVERAPGDGRLKFPKGSRWVAKRGRRRWMLESAAGGIEDDEKKGVNPENAHNVKGIDF